MDSWDPQVNEIFARAAQIESVTEQEAFLDNSCGEDKALREAVEALLASHHKAGSFLEQPATGIDRTIDVDPRSLDAGLAATFSSGAAVVIGNAGHSVLKSLGKNLTRVPRVTLPNADGKGVPATQPNTGSRYQMEGEIARGGMGAVLKGRDTDLGRDLAIKVLLDSHRDNPDVVARFIEEAQIGGQLQHPGIVPVHELGQFADERPFFSMKLVKGETLASLLRQRKDPSEDRPRFLGIFEQICQTMAYAHSRQVIHRDLKPANIMVGTFGEVQVMDWGLAKVLGDVESATEEKTKSAEDVTDIVQTLRSGDSDAATDPASQTRMGSVMGTPAYMPPEQALGEIDRLDERADVFGLGAILCEILTGQPPYSGEDAGEVYRQAAQAQLNDCFSRLDGCGVEQELVVLTKQALSAEPNDRLRNAGVLAERVTGYLEGVQERLKVAELEKVEALARAEEECRRRRLQFAIASLVLLFAVGAAIAAGQFRQLAKDNMELADANMDLAEGNRSQLYISDMNLALQDLRDGNLDRVVAALKRHRPLQKQVDLRHFEWYHLWNQCRQSLLPPTVEHGEVCFAVDYSPDGEMLATASKTDIILWDAGSLKEIDRFDSDPRFVWDVAFAPLGKLLATANQNGNVKIWDVENRALVREFPHGHQVLFVQFSPDGKTALSSSKLDVKTWNVATGKLLNTLERSGGRAAVFSPDGSYLAFADRDGAVRLWDFRSGEERDGFSVDGLATALDIAPNSKTVAVKHGQRVTLWDVQTKAMQVVTENYGVGRPIKFSPDGESLAYVGPGNLVELLDIKTRTVSARMPSGEYVNSIAFAPDGSTLTSGSGDGRVKVWDLATLQDGSTFESHALDVRTLSFSPDGRLLATGGDDGAVHVWETKTWTVQDTIRRQDRVVLCVEFSPDGETLAASFGQGESNAPIDIFDVKTRQVQMTLPGHPAAVWSVSFSPNGRYLASGGEMGKVKTWDLQAEGREVSSIQAEKPGKGAIRKVAFFPGGTRLVSGGDNVTSFWRVTNGSLQPHEGDSGGSPGAWALEFLPSGLMVAGTSGRLAYWDMETLERLGIIEDAGYCHHIASTLDGKTLASIDRLLVRLWDVNARRVRVQLRVPSVVKCLAFSPNGQTLVGGLGNGSIQLWHAAGEEEVQRAAWWKRLQGEQVQE